jgi:hypothetical protein
MASPRSSSVALGLGSAGRLSSTWCWRVTGATVAGGTDRRKARPRRGAKVRGRQFRSQSDCETMHCGQIGGSALRGMGYDSSPRL